MAGHSKGRDGWRLKSVGADCIARHFTLESFWHFYYEFPGGEETGPGEKPLNEFHSILHIHSNYLVFFH